MNLIHGTNVLLYTDGIAETVSNVLIGEPSSDFGGNVGDNDGRILSYTLGIPKNDTHDWTNKRVDFFGKTFRTVGMPVQGIAENIPLSWNMKIRAELMRTNGSCTFYDKDTFERHIFDDVFFFDAKQEKLSKFGTENSGEISAVIYSLNNSLEYSLKTGDILVRGRCSFEFDTASEQSVSESMAYLRKNFAYSFVSDIQYKDCGCEKPDIIVKAHGGSK